MISPLQRIERLRQHRAIKGKDVSITNLVAATAEDAAKTQKKMGELIALWEELIPPKLAAQSKFTGLRNGVLQVTAASSSVMYEIDRLLRQGIEEQIRSRHRGSLSRIKLRVGQLD
jgi:hypothetical protein